MLQHPNLEKWERRLKTVLDGLNDYLEDQYDEEYTLHPRRANRDTTSNKAHDGLFDIVAHFTLGKGSKYGAGYIVDVDIATLDKVSSEFKNKMDSSVVDYLTTHLPRHFPDKKLNVSKDGKSIKIYGDLGLGSAHR